MTTTDSIHPSIPQCGVCPNCNGPAYRRDRGCYAQGPATFEVRNRYGYLMTTVQAESEAWAVHKVDGIAAECNGINARRVSFYGPETPCVAGAARDRALAAVYTTAYDAGLAIARDR